MRRVLIGMLVVALSATIIGHYTARFIKSEPSFAGSARIAFASSLTGPGQAGAAEMRRAAEAYADEVNAAGGIDGLKVEIVPFDDGNDAQRARSVAETIAADTSILAVIGHNYSSASIAAGPVYASVGVPAVTPASTNPEVTRGNPWYFRSIFSDITQGGFLAQYARDALNGRTVAVLASTDAYARQVASSFVEAAGPAGLDVRGQWGFDPADAGAGGGAVDEAVAELGRLPSDTIVLLVSHIKPAVAIVRKLRDAGLANRILGPDSLGSAVFAQAFAAFPNEQARPGFYTNGLFVSVPFLTDTGNKEARRLIERLESQGEPLKTWGAPFAYDAAKLIVTAARRAGVRPGGVTGAEARGAVRDQLTAMRSWSSAITGATGPLQFDVNNTPRKPLIIGQFRDRLISSLVQLTFSDEGDGSTGGLRRTPVVYTGIAMDRIDAIDTAAGTARLTFDLWFRFQGDPPAADIVFDNAAEPIKLGEPQENISVGGIEYRLYRVSGRFKTNFDERRPVPGGVIAGVQFAHRTLSLDQIIYVADPAGLPASAAQKSAGAATRTQISDADWRIMRASAAADIIDRPTKGNPSQAKNGDDRRSFSNFAYRVELGPRDMGLRRQFTGEAALWAAVAATLALIGCLIVDRGGPAARLRRSRLMLTAGAAALFLITSESAVFDSAVDASADWAQMPIILTYNILWWLVPAALANMAIARFAWEPLERASDRVVPRIIQNFVGALVYFVALFGIFANVFQKDVTSLMATSGVLAMIIGLALQSNLSNIFSGIVLNLERPFRPGDWIKVGDAPMGKIIDISWRAMKVQTFNNSVLSIPNSLAASSRIENCSYPNRRYFIFQTLHFDRRHDPVRLTELLYDALRLTESVDGRRRLDLMWVKFNGVNEHGLKFLVAFDVHDRSLMNSQEHAVLTSLSRVFKKAGIGLANETNLHLFRGQSPVDTGALCCEAVLAGAELFAGLSAAGQERLAGSAIMGTFKPGEAIVRQGDPGKSLFVIAEGVVSMVAFDPKGEREIARFGPGCCFGETAVFTGEPQACTTKAIGSVTVYEIPREALLSVLEEHSALAERLHMLVAERRQLLQLPEPAEVGAQTTGVSDGTRTLMSGLKGIFRTSPVGAEGSEVR